MGEPNGINQLQAAYEDSNGEDAMNTSAILCAVCVELAAKYRCPRCQIISCSLACVKKHKLNSGCNGIRDKTAYVPAEKIDAATVFSDKCLLHDIKGNVSKRVQQSRVKAPKRSKQANILSNACQRNGTRLLIMPYNFTRRKNNSSIFKIKEKEIQWKIEWTFDNVPQTFTSARLLSETLVLDDCFNQSMASLDETQRNFIGPYTTVAPERRNYILKSTVSPGRYVRLDRLKSLRENLVGKTLVEYPVILVFMEEDMEKYRHVVDLAEKPWDRDLEKTDWTDYS